MGADGPGLDMTPQRVLAVMRDGIMGGPDAMHALWRIAGECRGRGWTTVGVGWRAGMLVCRCRGCRNAVAPVAHTAGELRAERGCATSAAGATTELTDWHVRNRWLSRTA